MQWSVKFRKKNIGLNWLINCIIFESLLSILAIHSKTLIEPRFAGLMNFNWLKNQKYSKKAACRIAHGFFTSITGPTLPSLAENTKVSVAEVSTIFSYRGLGNIVGAILAGIFFNRLPSGKMKLLSIGRDLIR